MKLKGFILIEVCIALICISLLSTCFYPLFKAYQRYQCTQHIEKIVYVLANFVLNNKRLPCPGMSTEEFPYSSNVTRLPYKTLGIPEKWSYLPNGHPIIYKVNPLLTKKNMEMDYKEKENDPFLSDTSTFCFTPIDQIDTFKNQDTAFILNDVVYPRSVFLGFYMHFPCGKKKANIT